MNIKLLPFLLLIAACGTAHKPVDMAHSQIEREGLIKSAEAGDAESQYLLGNAYCCDKTGYYNTAEAKRWWGLAAKQGHKEAQHRLETYKPPFDKKFY